MNHKTYLEQGRHLENPEYILNSIDKVDVIVWKLTPEFFEFVTQNIENIILDVEIKGYSPNSNKIRHEFMLTNPIETGFKNDDQYIFKLFKPFMMTTQELSILSKVIFY